MNPMRTPALLLLPLLLLVSAVLAGVGSDRAVAAKANPKAEAYPAGDCFIYHGDLWFRRQLVIAADAAPGAG